MEQEPDGDSKLMENALMGMWITCSNNAIKAISGTMQKEAEIKSQSIKRMSLKDVPKFLDSDSHKSTIVWMQLKGEVEGAILMSFSVDDILKLENILLHKKVEYFQTLSEENTVVIKELAKIIAYFYMEELVKLFDFKLKDPSLSTSPYRVPEFLGMGDTENDSIGVLALEALMNIPQEDISVNVFLLFREDFSSVISDNIRTTLKIASFRSFFFGSFLIFSHSSVPVMDGIITSMSIRSGLIFSSLSRHCWPLCAVTTSYPSFLRICSRSTRMSFSSSTTMTVFLDMLNISSDS